MTADARLEHRAALPITHVNGSARVQTINKKDALVQAVGKVTDHEMVLNTSFNVKGQPIVNTPARQGPEHEAQPLFGRADHRDFEGAGGRRLGCRPVSEAWCQRRQHLQMESQFGGLEVSEKSG
jgi:hypothetical protein